MTPCRCWITNETDNLTHPQHKRRYTWPWFVLAAVLLAILLAMPCMSRESADPAHP